MEIAYTKLVHAFYITKNVRGKISAIGEIKSRISSRITLAGSWLEEGNSQSVCECVSTCLHERECVGACMCVAQEV